MTNDSNEWKTRYEQLYEDYTEFQAQSNEIEQELETQNTQLQEQIKHITKKAQNNQEKYNDEIRSLQSRLSISQTQVDSLKETLTITQSDCERWRTLARQLEQSVEGFESKLRILTAKQESMSEELDDKTELLIMARQEFEEVTNEYATKQAKHKTLIQSLRLQIEELEQSDTHGSINPTDSITITAPNHFVHIPFNLTHLSEELIEESSETNSPQFESIAHHIPTNPSIHHMPYHKPSTQTAPVSPINHVSFHRPEHSRHSSYLGSSTPHSRHSLESDHSHEIMEENKTYSSPRLVEFIQRTDSLQHVHLHSSSHRRVRANSHTHIISVTPTHASMTRSNSRTDITGSTSPNSYHQRARSSIEPLSPAYPVSPNHQPMTRPSSFRTPKFNEILPQSSSHSATKSQQCNFLSESKQPLEHSHSFSHNPAPR